MEYPNQFHIELTQQCNLNCLHCFANASIQNTNEVSYDEVVEIYKQMRQLGMIYANLSGGEPLLNKDFFRILEFTANQPFSTCLLTNGLLWDDEAYNKISKIDPNRKLTIQISLDGPYDIMKKERLITKIQYDNIIKSIRKFRELGFKVGCLIVINALTCNTCIDTIKYALKDLNVNSVQAIPLFPTGRACDNRALLEKFWDDWSRFVVEITKIKKNNLWGEYSKRINIGFFTLYELTEPLDKANMHDDISNVWGLDVSTKKNFQEQTRRFCYCEAGQSELTISSDKKIYPCIPSIRTLFGGDSIMGKDIIDIWKNNNSLNWFRNCKDQIIKQEPCNSCNYAEICGGGCRITAYQLTGNKYAPDPRCPKVQEFLTKN